MVQLELGGKRISIPAGETVIGAASTCAVVLDGEGVRPRHALLYGTPAGAAIRAAVPEAGVLVNGQFVGDEPWPIAPGDRIRIGGHELVAVDAASGHHGSSGAYAGNAGASRFPLASFLVRSGELKGRRLYVRQTSVTIGRADSTDLVIADPSVGSEHATLSRRGGLWMLTDSGSATGTYVDGELVLDELPLISGATVRFGQVTALFEPHDDDGDQVGDERADDIEIGRRGAGRDQAPALVPAPSWAAIEPRQAEGLELARPSLSTSAVVDPPGGAETERSLERRSGRSEAHPEEPPEPTFGTGWLIAAVIVAAAAGAALGFVLIR